MARRFLSSSDFDDPMEDNNDASTLADNLEQAHHPQQLQQQQRRQTADPLQAGFLNRSKMNELIMDYMVHEGFKEAAERFREEAGIEPKSSTDAMDKRIEIRQLIEEGKILEGQSLINACFPELLDNHRELFFRLQQQHMLELIRQQKVEEVIDYVHNHVRDDDSSELVKTLALLAFSNPLESPYAGLLKKCHRLKLASDVNDTILQETTGDIELTKPPLVTLMKLVYWSRDELVKKKILYEKMPKYFWES